VLGAARVICIRRNRLETALELVMLLGTLVFLVTALISAVVGFTAMAAESSRSTSVAKWCFASFVVMFLVSVAVEALFR